jgi:hypothetical protein
MRNQTEGQSHTPTRSRGGKTAPGTTQSQVPGLGSDSIHKVESNKI